MGKSKRDPEEFIAKAEEEITAGWRRLSIFKSERPATLLKVITATDERLRIYTLGVGIFEAVYAGALRFGQDGLNYAIPWVFEGCGPSESAIPTHLTEADMKEGIELADYAEAYDSAVLGFTDYHRARYTAFVASRDPRITFKFASEEMACAALEKYAYEWQMRRTGRERDRTAEASTQRFSDLRDKIASKSIREGDRVKLDMDSELTSILRDLRDWGLAVHPADIPEGQLLAGVRYSSLRRYFAAIMALGQAHLLLHMSAAVSGIYGMAAPSLTLRMPTRELNGYIARISELDPVEVAQISAMCSFDGTIRNMPPICQPLIKANDTEVLIPHVFSLGSNLERNLLKMLARNPLTRPDYNKFSSSKESIALSKLLTLLRGHGIACRDRVAVTDHGRSITDIDVLAYDPRDRCLLVIQHKWLIEPDSVNESKDCDNELAKGIEKARVAKGYLTNIGWVRSLLPEVPPQGFSTLEALVLSKGFEPTAFVKEFEIPVVTEGWFTQQLKESSGLKAIYELARSRPDRKQLAQSWEPAPVSANLAGFEIKIPGFSRRGPESKNSLRLGVPWSSGW